MRAGLEVLMIPSGVLFSCVRQISARPHSVVASSTWLEKLIDTFLHSAGTATAAINCARRRLKTLSALERWKKIIGGLSN